MVAYCRCRLQFENTSSVEIDGIYPVAFDVEAVITKPQTRMMLLLTIGTHLPRDIGTHTMMV